MITIRGLTKPVVVVYRTVDARRTPGPWVSLRQQVVAVRPRRHHRQRRRRRESGSCRTPSVTSREMEVRPRQKRSPGKCPFKLRIILCVKNA